MPQLPAHRELRVPVLRLRHGHSSSAFNGAGDTWTPTWINLFCFWLWELPAAYAMAQWLDFGPMGVFLAIATSYSALAVVSAIVFRRGKWKARMV